MAPHHGPISLYTKLEGSLIAKLDFYFLEYGLNLDGIQGHRFWSMCQVAISLMQTPIFYRCMARLGVKKRTPKMLPVANCCLDLIFCTMPLLGTQI